MKRTILAILTAAGLSSCTTTPKPVDPFDAAIARGVDYMMGGEFAPNAQPGGAQ